MVVSSELRTHKVMEAAIRELMGAGTPPRFKFQDTYESIEFPSGYTIPAQATLEAKYDELLALEEDIQKTVVEGDLEVGTSNLFVDTETGIVGIGTDSPAYTLDVHGSSNVGALTTTSVSGDGSGLSALNASNLASGTVPSARLSLAASDIPSLDAGKITTGTLARPISTTTGTFSGNVGIGTASPMNTGLHIANSYFASGGNTTHLNPQIFITGDSGTGGNQVSAIGFSGNSSGDTHQRMVAGSVYYKGGGGNYGMDGYLGIAVANSSTGGSDPYGLTEGELESHTRIVIKNNGNVGIGTTSPVGKLHLYQSGSATNMIDKRTNISTNDYGQTLNYTHYSSVAQGANRDPDNSRGLWIGNMVDENDVAPSGANFVAFTNSFQFYVVADQTKYDDGLSFTSNTDTLKYSDGNFIKAMHIDSGGNVGIGTASPRGKLDIEDGVLFVKKTPETNTLLLLPDGDGTGALASEHFFGNAHTGVAQFVAEQSEHLPTISLINKDRDNVTTKNASIGFFNTDTSGSGKYAARIACYPDDANAINNNLRIYTKGGGGSGAGYTYPELTATFSSSGNVGIGTTSPSTKLHVQGTSSSSVNWIATFVNPYASATTGQGSGIKLQLDGANAWYGDDKWSGITSIAEANWGDKVGMAFYTQGNLGSDPGNTPTEKMRISGSGNVGIGTESPGYKLDVNGDIRYNTALRSSSSTQRLWTSGSTTTWIQFQTGGTSTNHILDIQANNGNCTVSSRATTPLLLNPTSGGNVGIGTTNPGYKLHVNGDIYATGNITGYSDKRAKSDIQKIENALDKIDKLNGYTFTMNDKRYTGVIAQEVLPVLPEAVTGSEETHYAVAYGNMMGLIIEAIKELKEKIG